MKPVNSVHGRRENSIPAKLSSGGSNQYFSMLTLFETFNRIITPKNHGVEVRNKNTVTKKEEIFISRLRSR